MKMSTIDNFQFLSLNSANYLPNARMLINLCHLTSSTFSLIVQEMLSLVITIMFSRNAQSWHFVLLKFEKKWDSVINRLNFNSKRHDKS